MTRSATTQELLPSERRFLAAMQALGCGRFEFLQVRHGELVLDPWPTTVRYVEFCGDGVGADRNARPCTLEATGAAAWFFDYIINFGAAEILTLEVRNGQPVSMDIELAAEDIRGGRP
jgi:hypothetical protein